MINKKIIQQLFFASLLIMVGINGKVYAVADPGCYEVSSDGKSYSSISCPSTGFTGDATKNCYFRTSPTDTNFRNISCSSVTVASTGGGTDTGNTESSPGGLLTGINDDHGKVEEYLQLGVNILTAVTGLAITVSVIFSGIQYSMSGGNPQSAAKAKERITNAVLAMVASLFLYTFLQWLIPGGVFG